MKTTRKSVWVLAVLFLATGCQKADLHHGLVEMEADAILNLLHENDIEAEKQKEISGQDVSWKVSVAAQSVARARQILVAHNLPRQRELGLSGVYKEKGLIPTPDEQKARFLLAMKGEIINSLEKIPGVVDIDIVLNVPEEDNFSDLDSRERRPTASVVAKTRMTDDGTIPVTEGKIQHFVANAVPNLNPNDVTVIVSQIRGDRPPSAGTVSLFPTPSGPFASPAVANHPGVVELAGIRMERESVVRMKAYFVGLLSLLVVVAAALLVTIVRFNRLRLHVQTGRPVAGVPLDGREPRLLDRGAREEGAVEGTFDMGQKS